MHFSLIQAAAASSDEQVSFKAAVKRSEYRVFRAGSDVDKVQLEVYLFTFCHFVFFFSNF